MFPAPMTARLPVQLTPEQCSAYTEVAYGVRDKAIALYESYLARDTEAPVFKPREWKLLKTKEHFQIFSSRRKHHARVYRSPYGSSHDPRSEIHRSAEWQPQSKLQCVGAFFGSLDEAMYGGVTATETAMMVRSLMIHDHFIDHKTLCDITLPTEDDPFTYVGLKWSARPPYLATMVRPRDLTYVQATGFCTVNHEGSEKRAGFHVYHSVENIPGVPEFTEYGFQRCRFSLCVLCFPSETSTVGVFATIASDAGGDLPRNLTTHMSANALMGIHKLMDNALQKKLVWLRSETAKATTRQAPSIAPVLGVNSAASGCPQCSRLLSVLHRRVRCSVCEASVCKRCITAQRLVVGRTKTTLRRVHAPTCTGCLTAASALDVRQLAILEFVRPFESDYPIDSPPATDSITSYFSRDSSGSSFFGTRDSAAFFSISSNVDGSISSFSDSQSSESRSMADTSLVVNDEAQQKRDELWTHLFRY